MSGRVTINNESIGNYFSSTTDMTTVGHVSSSPSTKAPKSEGGSVHVLIIVNNYCYIYIPCSPKNESKTNFDIDSEEV